MYKDKVDNTITEVVNGTDKKVISEIAYRIKWRAFLIICFGSLMTVIDETVVNVALPSIKTDLGFSNSSLAWVVNAYLITFGGFLLLTGRIGDLFGYRRIFLIGVALFTLASLASGLADSQVLLIIARFVQGLAAAIISSVSLSLIMNLFKDSESRAKAMGIFGFILAGGGSVGVFLGGIITNSFNWHMIFLINIPIGIIVCILSLVLIPTMNGQEVSKKLDVTGAISVTLAQMFVVYAIVNSNSVGMFSTQTLGLLLASLLLLILYFIIESRTDEPLIPFSILRLRNVATANIISILWAAAMFAWFFLSALYMQLVLGYSPLQVGLAFLPANIIMAIFSVSFSAKLVIRFGIRKTLTIGLVFAAMGLILFARSPINGNFFFDVLPGMIFLGLGAGIAFNPVLLAAMNNVKEHESGIASGIVNTSFMMGGALGLAILTSIAAAYTNSLLASGVNLLVALNSGYNLAFFIGTIFAILAFLLGLLFLHTELPIENIEQ